MVKVFVLCDGHKLFVIRSAAQIGRQLAIVGDDINNRYAPEFNQMIRMLQLTPETAYEAFAGVARKYATLFSFAFYRTIFSYCSFLSLYSYFRELHFSTIANVDLLTRLIF